MPQSFKYNNQSSETKDAFDWMSDLANEGSEEVLKSKIFLTWRQRDSFEKGQKLYPLVNNKLVPDVAFMIGPIKETDEWTSKEKVDFIFLLRTDLESVHKWKRNVKYIEKIIHNVSDHQNRSFMLADWWDHSKFHNDSIKEMPGPQLTHKVNKLVDGGTYNRQAELDVYKLNSDFKIGPYIILKTLRVEILNFRLKQHD